MYEMHGWWMRNQKQPRMWLNVVICLFVIQPRFGVAGLLYIHFNGLHPWLFTLNPAGSHCRIKIATRFNMNSHVWNAWLMNVQSKTTTNVVECCYLFVRGCRFIGRSFPRVAPMVIRIPRVSPVANHIEPCGFRLSNKNRNAIEYE